MHFSRENRFGQGIAGIHLGTIEYLFAIFRVFNHDLPNP